VISCAGGSWLWEITMLVVVGGMGTACALGMIVLVLKPAILILSVTALLNATWVTAEVMLAAWLGVQFGYLGGAAARSSIVAPGIWLGAPPGQS
jgi:hypothetical protein